MSWRRRLLGLITVAATVGGASSLVLVSASPAQSASQGIAALALANIGKGAGTCSTVNPSLNSLGGTAFESSCSGYLGKAEAWCADFAKWVWRQNGVRVAGLTAAAGSFVSAAAQNGSTVHSSSSYVPQVGDAVVYGYDGAGRAGHVGLVTSVKSDGSVVTANGNFGGPGGSQTSKVRSRTLTKAQRSVGSRPASVNQTITNYVTPGGRTQAPVPSNALAFNGSEVAFAANTGKLWSVGSDLHGDWKQGVMAGTSPSITALTGGGYQMAYQANTGDLITMGSAGNKNWKLGMKAGTSPSITGLANGSFEVAFVSNVGSLWSVGSVNQANWNLGMKAGTSPSIAKAAIA